MSNTFDNKLLDRDFDALKKSFISRSIAEKAQIFRTDSAEGASIIGRKPNANADYSGIVFPYFSPLDGKVRERRLRRDQPDLEQNSDGELKEKGKYLTAPGGGNMLYFPPDSQPEWLTDVNLDIFITEGEKKCLALYRVATNDEQHELSFLPLAVSGVWNWRGNVGKTADANGNRRNVKGVIPDFKLIEWKNRTVTILFDANVNTNESVKSARNALAAELQKCGAKVFLIDLLQADGVNGIDDLLYLKSVELKSDAKAIEYCLELLGRKTDVQAINEKIVLSQILSDNRIIEALSTKEFAVFDPQTQKIEYVDSVRDGETIYKPMSDSLTMQFLADRVEGYESETELITEISDYINRHYDLDETEVKYASYYVLLTYLFDKMYEVPYLHPIGDSGSGKTRFGETIISACYRGLFLHSVTSASLFRLINKYHCTVFLDEFNLSDSGDTENLIQILNAGWSAKGVIPRCDVNLKLEFFNVFGCKIIASLKKLQSDALESRCIEIKTKETLRNDILFCNVGQIEADAKKLKRKLLMYRFRNLHRHFADEIIEADRILKTHKIRARVIQKACALFALIQDEQLKTDFIATLKNETKISKELKEQSFDAEVVQTIHHILFERGDDEQIQKRSYFKGELIEDKFPKTLDLIVKFNENEICPALAVENIVSLLNQNRDKKSEISTQGFGKTLVKNFGLKTEQDNRRNSQTSRKRVVVFNAKALLTLFEKYQLPVSGDFNVSNVSSNANLNLEKNLNRPHIENSETSEPANVSGLKSNADRELQELLTLNTFNLAQKPADIQIDTFAKTEAEQKNESQRRADNFTFGAKPENFFNNF